MANLAEKVNQVEPYAILVMFQRNTLYDTYDSRIVPKDARQWAKETNKIRDKIRNLQPVTYEEMKLLETRKEVRFELSISPYKNMDELVDMALEKWLKRI
jgi:hypothetical protein